MLLERALEEPSERRAAFLQSACGGESGLFRELMALLPYADTEGHFMADPILQVAVPDVIELFGGGEPGFSLPEEIGGYRLVRQIGNGGMGVIYEALQFGDDRAVALKLMHPGSATPALRRRFAAEAQLLGRLHHQGIVRIYEAGLQELSDDSGMLYRLPFLVMELVHGQRLDHFVARRQLDLHQRLVLFGEICDAVDHAHLRGVIHRDLKPSNILVQEDHRPKLVDFGIARTAEAVSSDLTHLTSTGQVLGSLPYMSPEQLVGDRQKVDARCDVFALGVILYQLITGRLPYDVRRRSIREILTLIYETQPQPLDVGHGRWNRQLQAVVAEAMAADRQRRFGSAAELQQALHHLLDQGVGRH